MRKQPRLTAKIAVFLLSTTMVVGTLLTTTESAASASTRSRRSSYAAPATPENFQRLRQCESGDNYATRTGNGFYGAYQFSLRTWQSLGFSGLPSDADPATQDRAAQQLQARSGWGQWPACSRRLHLR